MTEHRLDGDQLMAAVVEFYTTTDAQRRQQLDAYLCAFKSDFDCVPTIATCMRMISGPAHAANIRHFATISMYDVVRTRSDECVANETLRKSIKTFIIDALTHPAYGYPQSVVAKLSSTLALLALHCIPDVWHDPVADLTPIFSANPELLLRLLSDFASEFAHICMPLQQRSVLKTQLHRMSNDIILVIGTVFQSQVPSPAIQQAAVDCVEQWLRLPGISLDNWKNVIFAVFQDARLELTSITNIINILADNDDVPSMRQFMLDVCNHVTSFVSSHIRDEIDSDACSEEATSLVAAVCSFLTKAVPTLLDVACETSDDAQYWSAVQLMANIAALPGRYPTDEAMSDMPTAFFANLRDHLLAKKTASSARVQQVLNATGEYYFHILKSAINKLAYPTGAELEQYSSEDMELFTSYRSMRSEVSLDSFYVSGNATLFELNKALEEALNANEVNRSESLVYLWECVADYLSEENNEPMLGCVQIVASRLAVGERRDDDEKRRAASAMRLLYALSHLLQSHEMATQLEEAVYPLMLACIESRCELTESLTTLQKYVEERSQSLETAGEQISNVCYELFNDGTQSKKARLLALKCIGCVISTRKPETTMDIICRILGSNMQDLDGLSDKEKMERYSFQINIFSALFSSLNAAKSRQELDNDEPSIVKVLREAIPVLERICGNVAGGRLIDDVCDAVKCALNGLPDVYVTHFFPFVVNVLNAALMTNAQYACSLAKSTVLRYGPLMSGELCEALARWFEQFERNLQDAQLDEWLLFIYQVMKKELKLLRKTGPQSMQVIKSALNICAMTIVRSEEPCVVRTSSQILACIATYTSNNDDGEIKEVLAKYGVDLIKAIFARVQSELMRQTVEALAEVLFFYFKQFTTETRQLINNEPYGTTPLVAAMFRDIGNLRNFKQMTIRLNNAAIRDAKS